MKAFILCAGLGTRLRPLTYSRAKASCPFLNLPLLSYGWFYLEQMGCSHLVLNNYIFPEQLKKDIEFLKTPSQKTSLVVEEKLLDSGSGFYNVRQYFKEEAEFFYLNGDSLFFPSDLNLLKKFKDDFSKSDFESSFFCMAQNTKTIKDEKGFLWIDKEGILRGIGSKKKMQEQGFLVKISKNLEGKELRPVQFTGLALFRSRFLPSLARHKTHIFKDVMEPCLKNGQYHVFVDEKGILLEGGVEQSQLQASKFCLTSLFQNSKEASAAEVKSILEKVFSRFDPKDQKVGLQFGKKLSQQVGAFVLAPSDLQGLENLKVEDFAVLGSKTTFTGKSFLKRVILAGQISWRGSLQDKILIKSVV